MLRDKEALAELKQIENENGGYIVNTQVLERAREEASALHKHFEWGDDVAAENFRLLQANQLIRAVMKVMPRRDGGAERVHAYVSLSEDRGTGVYRAIATVMSDQDMHAAMLADALRDFAALERKYGKLRELAPLFDHVRTVRAA